MCIGIDPSDPAMFTRLWYGLFGFGFPFAHMQQPSVSDHGGRANASEEHPFHSAAMPARSTPRRASGLVGTHQPA